MNLAKSLAVSLAYLLSTRSWDRSAAVLVISGIVVSAFFQAGLSILMYVANPYDQLAQIIFWIMGSFHSASWARVQTTLPIVVIGTSQRISSRRSALRRCAFSSARMPRPIFMAYGWSAAVAA